MSEQSSSVRCLQPHFSLLAHFSGAPLRQNPASICDRQCDLFINVNNSILCWQTGLLWCCFFLVTIRQCLLHTNGTRSNEGIGVTCTKFTSYFDHSNKIWCWQQVTWQSNFCPLPSSCRWSSVHRWVTDGERKWWEEMPRKILQLFQTRSKVQQPKLARLWPLTLEQSWAYLC